MKSYSLSLLFILSIIGCRTQSITENEKSQVMNELNEMVKIDQVYAGIPSKEFKEKYGVEKAWEIFEKIRDSVNLVNQDKAKTILKKHGFIGTKNFTPKASSNLWLIVQHADNDIPFQKKYLKQMEKELKKQNANKTNFAYLEDRINVNTGNKQRFGTQVDYNKRGQAIPKNGLVDSINIENLRKEYGLDSFKKYYNDMTSFHFDMNKEILIKSGINEPQLYK